MQQHDMLRRPHPRDGPLELQCFVDRLVDKPLDALLPPRLQGALPESPGKALHTSKADAPNLTAIAIEHLNAGLGEDTLHLLGLSRLIVVVPQHRNDWNLQGRYDLLRQNLRLLREAVIGEIAAQQEDVSAVVNRGKQRLQCTL